jgi:hypothetical protein
MRLYELKIEDSIDEVYAISLVEAPAIESDFIYFGKDDFKFAKVNNEQRLILGPILLPDKKILRVDAEGEPYEVYFTKETVKKLAQNYLKRKYTDKATLEHDKSVKGVHLVESWIKEGRLDKSSNYGLSLPEGAWVGIFSVDESKEGQDVWENYVKTGKVKGFSVESIVSHKLVKASETIIDKDVYEMSDEEAELFLSSLRALIKRDNRFKDKKRVEMESYSDYGSGVKGNAKRGIELNEKNGNKCATQTGKVRAQQLANGEPISLETIKRMHSYLSRAETYYDNADSTSDCGYISYLLWGGKSALSWSRNKLRELGELDLAVIGPRGGIVKSPKAPKGDTPNPNPKGEGTAKGDASGKSAKVSAEDEKTLQGKVDDFNKKDSNTKYGRATLGQLKSVFQRGLGAFNVSHSPLVKSASQWAFARVNAYLYLLKNGRPESAKYTTDYDLLPKGHPKADK